MSSGFSRLPISPRLVRTKASQKTDLARVIYANSITLTPGTVTCAVDGDELTIQLHQGRVRATTLESTS